jgi:AraC-like DNA-binding protein
VLYSLIYLLNRININMDALSAILEATKLESVVYKKLDVCAPWGLDIAQDDNSQYWRLIKGCCVVGLQDGQTIEMKQGDLVFIPHGSSHWIADKPTSQRIPAAEYVKARDKGSRIFGIDGEQTIVTGGHFQFDDQPIHPFLKDLPNVIHIAQFETEHQVLLQHCAQLILAELNNERLGSKIILRGLAEVLFINIIRAYVEQVVPQTGFLSALIDTHIASALRLIQDAPANAWTIDTLAKSVSMSRSVFFNRFKRLVGETPLDYLTNWRIRKAKEMLAANKDNISEIALQVGYQSEAAFNRIFKTKVGSTPAAFRRALV